MRFSRRFHAERLVWAPVVIELDPVGDDPHRMLLGLEAVTMHTLFLQGPDNALDQAVLLRTVRRDELLFQPSNAEEAVVASPLLESCHPSSSRLWQSITNASVNPPSLPAQTRLRSQQFHDFARGLASGSTRLEFTH